MSILTPEQRGDLAEEMLPTAAHLAVLVHGDGGPEDIAEVLAGLDDTQKTALIVALAGLVDPEQPLGKALGWLDFDEHGALTVPVWQAKSTVRQLADEVQPALEDDDTFIDEVAVEQFIEGKTRAVTPRERMEAIRRAARRGISYLELDAVHGLRSGTTAQFVSRERRKYAARGEEFPEIVRPGARRDFTEAEVIAIRERAAAGATFLELSMAYDVSRDTIRGICHGHSYTQFGGPTRSGATAQGLRASRDHMCGHADNSQAAAKKHEMGAAA